MMLFWTGRRFYMILSEKVALHELDKMGGHLRIKKIRSRESLG